MIANDGLREFIIFFFTFSTGEEWVKQVDIVCQGKVQKTKLKVVNKNL